MIILTTTSGMSSLVGGQVGFRNVEDLDTLSPDLSVIKLGHSYTLDVGCLPSRDEAILGRWYVNLCARLSAASCPPLKHFFTLWCHFDSQCQIPNQQLRTPQAAVTLYNELVLWSKGAPQKCGCVVAHLN